MRYFARIFGRQLGEPHPIRNLRTGMWINSSNGVGILTQFIQPAGGPDPRKEELAPGRPATLAEVHLVNDDGTTKLVIVLPIADLRQAKLNEIPGPRRPKAKDGRQLGYV